MRSNARSDGAVAELAAGAEPGTRVINAGDGRSNHPTQGLLDMLTLRQHKGADFSRLKVLLAGDVLHSRVVRSDLQSLPSWRRASCTPSRPRPMR